MQIGGDELLDARVVLPREQRRGVGEDAEEEDDPAIGRRVGGVDVWIGVILSGASRGRHGPWTRSIVCAVHEVIRNTKDTKEVSSVLTRRYEDSRSLRP